MSESCGITTSKASGKNTCPSGHHSPSERTKCVWRHNWKPSDNQQSPEGRQYEVLLIDTNCLLKSDSFVMAYTMPWRKKILKDRMKPFAIAVEECLEQAAHKLSSSGWCLLEQGFAGTRMDVKWVTTTAGDWCQFWQAGRGMHRVLRAESGVHWLKPSLLTLTATQTLLEDSTHSGPARKEKEWHCLEQRSQLARQGCTAGALFLCAQRGQWHMASNGDRLSAAHGPPDMSVLRWLGQGRKSQQLGGWAEAQLSSGVRVASMC